MLMFQIGLIATGCTILVAQAVAFWRLRQLLRRFHRRKMISSPSLFQELPSVSICIPARNERHAMTRCLEAVLRSNYKKMEVLVLDDDSVDNTSQLIRAFAKDGVRFVEGSAPPTGWLGKNYALQRLASEASGTYILFLDVDTILSASSISQLVSYAENTKANMVSILPVRSDLWRASVVFAPLRYFWSILFHSAHRPVAASNAWMVRRKQLLHDFDKFEALRVDIEPEVTIAELYLASRSYRFLTSRQLLGVTYEKKWRSQVETVLRLRFPQYRYSVWRTLLAFATKLVVALAPFIFLLTLGDLTLLGILIYLAGVCCYYMYLCFTWDKGAFFGAWLWPVLLIQDAVLTLTSMVGYKADKITWKGRPITMPRRR